jgi:hypothetical protein
MAAMRMKMSSPRISVFRNGFPLKRIDAAPEPGVKSDGTTPAATSILPITAPPGVRKP